MASSWKYDVFVSYSVADSGKTFTSHLFSALERNGLEVKYDQNIERGEFMEPELLKAIEESRCSIVVLSKTYAFSTHCLKELEKIVECKNSKGHKVYPLFYDVDPSDVRNQAGKFKEAFAQHEKTFKRNKEMIENWKRVLTKLADLSGWHLKNSGEAYVVEDIVKKISKSVRYSSISITDKLVGIDRQLDKLKKIMSLNSEDVRFIGIWGMGGIGKTTLASVAYDYASMSTHFDGKSFLSNVREKSVKHGLVSLQLQLLSQSLMEEPSKFGLWCDQQGAAMIKKRVCRRKVLLVIDDVDHIDQLTYLAGSRDWFGLGSRIIITSRDEHLLRTGGVQMHHIYKLKALNNQEALQLLSLHAFKTHQPLENFANLCNVLVEYCEGLPLALRVLGSFLCGRSVNEWKGAIKRLKMGIEDKIFNVLRISFDGLQENDKNIFLDIACFFQGKEVNYVTQILDACGFQPSIGVNVLVEKCLLTHEEHFHVHDLLQEMGRKIVELESPTEPGKRRRLWKEDEIRYVLTQNTGTNAVEVIMCEDISREIHVAAEAFLNMGRLRLLKVNKLVFSQNLTYLPNTLRILDWDGYPFKYLPSSFEPDEIVQINIPSSSIVDLWEEMKHSPKLKSIDLGGSRNLIKTPNFEGALSLEFADFTRCPALSYIDPSIGYLKSLTKLNFRDCKNLKRLPENLGELIYLEELDASETAIQTLPSMSGLTKLQCLSFVSCDRLLEIHPSVGTLQRLALFDLGGCTSLRTLPSSVNGWTSLYSLYLNNCSMLQTLPEDLGEAKCLTNLSIRKTAISQLPSSISCLTNLQDFDFKTLQGNLFETDIHHIGALSSLEVLTLGSINSESLPEFIGQLTGLENLEITKCKRLKSLSSLSGLTSLRRLELSDCNLSDEAIHSCDISQLSSLETLNLSYNNFNSLPPSLYGLSKLKELNLERCKRLDSLSLYSLANLERLGSLNLRNCVRLTSLPYWSREAILPYLIPPASSGIRLDLSSNMFECFPIGIISHFPRIYNLYLTDCTRLRSITKLPSTVYSMWAGGCVSLETLPDNTLPKELSLLKCHKLNLNQGCNSVTLPLLRRYFQELSNYKRGFWFCVPGSEMPKWFDHQREGIGINIQAPFDLFSDDIQWKGFAICFDFTLKSQAYYYYIDIQVNGKTITRANFGHPGSVRAMSNHQLVMFLARENFDSGWISDVDDRFSLSGCEPNVHSGLVIRKCGVRVMYNDNVEELIQLQTSQHHSLWCHTCSSTNGAAESDTSERDAKKSSCKSGLRVGSDKDVEGLMQLPTSQHNTSCSTNESSSSDGDMNIHVMLIMILVAFGFVLNLILRG